MKRPDHPMEVHNFISLEQFALKPGDPVDVLRDDKRIEQRTVKYEPWQLGDGTWVVGVAGISGGYALCRVTPRKEAAVPS